MGALYVVGVPAGNPDDLTYRAQRVLESARLWVAADPAVAQSCLATCGVAPPATGIAVPRHAMAALLEGDVALVVDGARPGMHDEVCRLVVAALQQGVPVIPVPGPALPLTALVVSGLPADTFLHVGNLPEPAGARAAMLDLLAAERRTLLFLVGTGDVESTLQDLHRTFGDRPLVIVSGTGSGPERPWRGTLQAAREDTQALPGGDDLVFVVGGATEAPAAWDEARLAAAIERRVARGEGAKEISQALARVSGWPRREIYRRATARTGTQADW